MCSSDLINATRAKLEARCVVASNYGLASWLAFYLPPGTPVVQLNERIRWVNAPEPDPALFSGPILYVGDANIDPTAMLRRLYASVTSEGQVSRKRNGRPIETYRLDRLADPKGDPLDRTPPAELR